MAKWKVEWTKGSSSASFTYKNLATGQIFDCGFTSTRKPHELVREMIDVGCQLIPRDFLVVESEAPPAVFLFLPPADC